jgi:hypothetical protein
MLVLKSCGRKAAPLEELLPVADEVEDDMKGLPRRMARQVCCRLFDA